MIAEGLLSSSIRLRMSLPLSMNAEVSLYCNFLLTRTVCKFQCLRVSSKDTTLGALKLISVAMG